MMTIATSPDSSNERYRFRTSTDSNRPLLRRLCLGAALFGGGSHGVR